jgi:hypothetical protein
MKIKEYLKLNITYKYTGDYDSIVEHIRKNKKYKVTFESADTYKIYSDTSAGTLIINDSFVSSIYVFATIKSISNDEQQIIFRTDIRNEHYFIAFVSASILIGMTMKDINFILYLVLIVFWAISHAWFQFFYRAQEELIVADFVKWNRLMKISN